MGMDLITNTHPLLWQCSSCADIYKDPKRHDYLECVYNRMMEAQRDAVEKACDEAWERNR